MASITIRVNDDLKRRMKKFSYVNWSKVVRKEIKKIVEMLEGKNLAIALLINERVRKKSEGDITNVIKRR